MGALITFGRRRGGEVGSRIANQVWAWVIIGLIFGASMENVNNYGHIGGLIGGFVMGGIFPNREGVPESSAMRWLAYILLLLSFLSVGLSINEFRVVFQLSIPT